MINVVMPICGPTFDLVQKSLAAVKRQNVDVRVILVSDQAEQWCEICECAKGMFGDDFNSVVLPAKQQGFVAAINAGLRRLPDDGDILLLNSDAYMATGCLAALQNALREDARIGVVGPLTNDQGYQSVRQLAEEAGLDSREVVKMSPKQIAEAIDGNSWIPFHTLSFFCALISRRAYKAIGLLSTQRELWHGLMADNEWCLRAERAGFLLALHLGAFCDHAKKSQTFKRLGLPRKKWHKAAVNWYAKRFGRKY